MRGVTMALSDEEKAILAEAKAGLAKIKTRTREEEAATEPVASDELDRDLAELRAAGEADQLEYVKTLLATAARVAAIVA